MITLLICRESRDLAASHTFRVGRCCAGAYLLCLLTLFGACRIASAAGADGDTPPPIAGNSDGLVTETEEPEDHEKVIADSLYPAADSPQELTLEQLEAIAKLAPKINKAGIKVHPAMVPLFRSMTLHYTGGTYKNAPIRFRLHTPEPYQEGKKYPMVVWLHGAGQCGVDNVNQLSHLHHIIPSLVGPKKRDFFLLVPQCPHSHVGWEAPSICSTTVRPDGSVECQITDDPVAVGDAPLTYTLAMIDAVMKKFPVDPNRVTVAGASSGGEGVWRILERRPDLFAAAVPLVSWQTMHEKSLREKPLLKKIPIWAIYSSDDRAVDFARKEFERMRAAGCRVFRTEFGVCGHRAWTPAMLQGDVFGWLISRAKDGDRYFAAEPSPTSPEQIGAFAEVTEGDQKRVPTKAAVRPERADAAVPASPAVPSQEATAAVDPIREGGGRIARRTVEKEAALEPSAQPTPLPQVAAPFVPFAGQPIDATVDQFRLELVERYMMVGQINKAIAVADKVRNRQEVIKVLLHTTFQSQPQQQEVLAYIDRELDRMDERGASSAAARPYGDVVGDRDPAKQGRPVRPKEPPLKPIAVDKQSSKDECGKEWAMSPMTLYGLFPNGWDQESNRVPDYIINETGNQLRDRLAKAFRENDLVAMKEFCESFIRLDDIPLSSPWFDTSGGRLQGRIKYALNEKAKPVVELLRDIAQVKAEAKKELAELARKSLERIDAIVASKTSE